jgi:hypothetical protein
VPVASPLPVSDSPFGRRSVSAVPSFEDDASSPQQLSPKPSLPPQPQTSFAPSQKEKTPEEDGDFGIPAFIRRKMM